MHSYERYILYRLALADQKRFSELRPKGAETNLFVYHIHKLIREGLVRKVDKGYALTASGTRYVDKLSLRNFEPRFQPKIVTLIICKNPKREYLLYTRKQQPFYGLIGFPYGKIHFGEKIKQAAERELREKTGLQANLIHSGDAYLTVSQNGELLTHMLAHVFVGTNPRGEAVTDSETGQARWGKIAHADAIKFIPGFLEILKATTKSAKPFFLELSIGGSA